MKASCYNRLQKKTRLHHNRPQPKSIPNSYTAHPQCQRKNNGHTKYPKQARSTYLTETKLVVIKNEKYLELCDYEAQPPTTVSEQRCLNIRQAKIIYQ